MSVNNGFIIISMVFLIVYSFYRLFKRKSLIMLFPVSGQFFSLTIAVLIFADNIQAKPLIPTVCICLGIFLPVIILLSDYIKLIRRLRLKSIYEGLVIKRKAKLRSERILPVKEINQIAGEKRFFEVFKELDTLPEKIQKNLRKCLSHAHSLIRAGDHTGGYYIYNTVAKIADSFPSVYYNLACVCYRLERFEEAAANFKKTIELSGGNGLLWEDASYNLGNACYMLDMFDKAIERYELVIAAKPDYADAIENLAFAYIRLGDISKSIEILNKSSEKSAIYGIHFLSGKLLHEAGRLDEALEELNKCIGLRPYSLEVQKELTEIYVKLDKKEEALESYKKIIKLDPGGFTARCRIAALYGSLGRCDKAVLQYKGAIKVRPDSYESYFNMAMALEECGRQEEAIEAYKKVIEINPDFIEAYNNLGVVLSTTGLFKEAEGVFERGTEKDPVNFNLFFNSGVNYFESGKYLRAVQAYRKALEIEPRELEVYYYLGAALTELRRYNDAVAAYKKAIKIKPSNGELHYNISAIYSMLGRYDIAEDNLRRAIALDAEIIKRVRKNSAFDGMRDRAGFKGMVS